MSTTTTGDRITTPSGRTATVIEMRHQLDGTHTIFGRLTDGAKQLVEYTATELAIEPACSYCGTTPEPELREVRIGSTEHMTTDAAGAWGARTLCGLALAGTPVSPYSHSFCQDCQARQGCDECGHGVGTTDTHLWAPATESTNPEAARFIYDNATCWAEHICRECNPALYAEALNLLGVAEATAEQLH